ncbi:NADP-dependent oxidoreductase domain-containing protein [Favolaschia claudopus]|uniref:NADP-dependent oxidoreductase domain-containing protein n=1 Tax=Favolaschia claudopus TaxID=2862362 RepID=A0AAW0DK78_9AGAR
MSQKEYPVFDTKGMPFRRLGNSGLRVPVLSLGGWLTLGGSVTGDPVKEIIQTAFESGINMFDTAEAYAKGKSELEMGRVIKELGYKRSDLVVTTKIFWGLRSGPNDTGLSRKHIIEATQECLERLQMTYVDVIFAHRPDRTVPMEEVVRAFNYVIEKGWAFYWGTSEWSAQEIEEAYHVASRLNLIAPIAEQMQHNMFHRERPEKEYAPLYQNYGYGTTVWSPLDSGMLTGKYNNGIPEGSRFATEAMFKNRESQLKTDEGLAKIEKVKELTKVAESLGSTPTALALAWLAKNPNTSTIILGVTSVPQLKQNLEALKVLPLLTNEHMAKIEEILGNKPDALPTFGRAALDPHGKFLTSTTMSSALHPEYLDKGMPFRRLGPSGLRVPLFSLGGWLTIGGSVTGDPVKEIINTAFENGINMFDTAEDYSKGNSEREMGRVFKELGFRRTDLVVSTKIFWGPRDGPNDKGLSRKHIIEGTQECLERLQLTYVDVIFAHRCDITVPMEEIVRAFNYVIEKGWAFYWGTSEWTAQQIEEAHHIATKLNLIGPVAEQCRHNMLYRERPEKEYAPLYKKYGMGTTAFSALAAGMLTGKYNDGIPEGSRFATVDMYKTRKATLASDEGLADIAKVKEITKFAAELNSTPTALALAWVAKNPNTSTVILGASSSKQLLENLKALEVLPKMTEEVMERIEKILGNRPEAASNYGRSELDRYGRQD